MKRSDSFGANSLQCSNCHTVTKSAENLTSNKRIALMEHIGQWPSEHVEKSRDVTEQLTQLGIANAINMSRSNISKIVEPLISAGLVRKKRAHIMGADGRNIGKHMKHVYYLTAKGRQTISPRDSRRAEEFSADMWDGIYKDGTTYNGLRYPHWRDCGCPENMLELRGDWGNCFEIHCESHGYLDQICATQMRELLTQRRFDTTIAGFRQLNPLADFEAESFSADTKRDIRKRRKTPFYELLDEEESEDKEVNKYARNNAGGALWQATYHALRDEGRSHEQAEVFCNTKFFDRYYEYLIEGLRQPMRNLIKNLQKPHHGLTKKQRKDNRDANKSIERYFPDKASEEFEAHEGGHIDDIGYHDSFMAEEPFICPECRRASTKSKTSQVCVRCESEYQSGRNAPMQVPWPGSDGYYAETFEADASHCTHCGWNLVQVPIGTETKWGVAIEGNQYYYNHNACRGIGKLPIKAETFEEPFICPECRRASTKSKTSQVCVRCESEYQSGRNAPIQVPWPGSDGYYAETFDRHKSRNKRKKCNRPYCTKPIIVDFNGYCSQLCESKEKPDWMAAESVNEENCVSCETPEYMWGALCSDSGEKKCIACCYCDSCHIRYSKLESGEIEGAKQFKYRAETFKAPNRYPVRPTRPSDDDYLPPRRPNRRPIRRPGRRPR